MSSRLKEAEKIQSKIVELRCAQHANGLLGKLFDALEWAKINDLVPHDFPNPYKFYKENIKVKKHRAKPLPGMIVKTGVVKPRFKYSGYLP